MSPISHVIKPIFVWTGFQPRSGKCRLGINRLWVPIGKKWIFPVVPSQESERCSLPCRAYSMYYWEKLRDLGIGRYIKETAKVGCQTGLFIVRIIRVLPCTIDRWTWQNEPYQLSSFLYFCFSPIHIWTLALLKLSRVKNIIVDTTSMVNNAKSFRKSWRQITGNVCAQLFTINSNHGPPCGILKIPSLKGWELGAFDCFCIYFE